MNAKRTMICVLLAALLLFALAACTPSEQDKPGEKTVSEIAVKTLPDTVEYFVGDEFSVAGGVITVTYSDETTEDVAMTDAGVEITAPNTSRVGEKTVTVKYGGEKTTFKVTVVMKGYSVTFDYNYDGAPAAAVQNVMEGEEPAAAPRAAEEARRAQPIRQPRPNAAAIPSTIGISIESAPCCMTLKRPSAAT